MTPARCPWPPAADLLTPLKGACQEALGVALVLHIKAKGEDGLRQMKDMLAALPQGAKVGGAAGWVAAAAVGHTAAGQVLGAERGQLLQMQVLKAHSRALRGVLLGAQRLEGLRRVCAAVQLGLSSGSAGSVQRFSCSQGLSAARA